MSGTPSPSPSAGRLVVQLEGNPVTTLELIQPVLGIGRTPDNGLSLPHPMVSRRHAELRLAPEGVLLTDVGSTHGTRVGGDVLPPHQPRVLAHGDVITIAPFTITWLVAEVPSAEDEGTVDPTPVVVEQPAPVVAAGDGEDGGSGETGVLTGGGKPAGEAMPVVVAPAPLPTRPARERFLMPLPPRGPSSYLRDLPVIYQESDFLGRFLKIFETIWEPLEARQARIELYFDPATCPAELLPWLASWLDMHWNPHWPEARARRLVAGAMESYRWRGTRYGLERILEIHTGVTPEIREDASEPHVFRVRFSAPAGTLDRTLIEDVIQLHKPAHTGYVLEIAE